MGRKPKERREQGAARGAPFEWPPFGSSGMSCGYCPIEDESDRIQCRPNGTFDPVSVAQCYLDRESWAFNCVCDMQWNHPEACLELIKIALPLCRTQMQLSLLAAGALESMLGFNGERIIGAVEAEARRDPAFKDLLGGVWKHGMSEAVWARVLAASDRSAPDQG
jgi:hypothetical protein